MRERARQVTGGPRGSCGRRARAARARQVLYTAITSRLIKLILILLYEHFYYSLLGVVPLPKKGYTF